jgi:hypothetical protein
MASNNLAWKILSRMTSFTAGAVSIFSLCFRGRAAMTSATDPAEIHSHLYNPLSAFILVTTGYAGFRFSVYHHLLLLADRTLVQKYIDTA